MTLRGGPMTHEDILQFMAGGNVGQDFANQLYQGSPEIGGVSAPSYEAGQPVTRMGLPQILQALVGAPNTPAQTIPQSVGVQMSPYLPVQVPTESGASSGKTKSGKKNRVLDVLDTLTGVFSALGPVIFGPQFSPDFGALLSPITGAMRLKQQREGLIELMQGSPEMRGIMGSADQIAQQGGLINMINSMSGQNLEKLSNLGVIANIQQKKLSPLDIEEQQVGIDYKKVATDVLLNKKPEPTFQEQQDAMEARQRRNTQFRIDEQIRKARTLGLGGIDRLPAAIDKSITDKETQDTTLASMAALGKNPDVLKEWKAFNSYVLSKGIKMDEARNLMEKKYQNLFKLYAASEVSLQQYGYSISGTAITENEMQRLKSTQPSVLDTPEAFANRIKDIQVLNRLHRLDVLAGHRTQFFTANKTYGDPELLQKYVQYKKLLKDVRVKQGGKLTDKQWNAIKAFRNENELNFSFEAR